MSGTYTHTTFQQLTDRLASELNDSGKVFFTDAELKINLIEALRVLNSLTGVLREVTVFRTTAGTAFYDLEVVLKSYDDPSKYLLAKEVTVNDVVSAIQYRLMDPSPIDPVASTGISDMFDHASIVAAVQRVRDTFLVESKQVIEQQTPIIIPAVTSTVKLPEEIINIVRATFTTLSGKVYNLLSTDELMATSMVPNWKQTSGIPRYYSIAAQPQLTLQLIPPPSEGGTLQLYTVQAGATLDTTTVPPTTLGTMDDSSWAVIWGAMRELLLRDGIGKDPSRAEFCGSMYEMGVKLAIELPQILTVEINGRQVIPVNIAMLDKMRNGWEGESRDTPRIPAVLGDWLAFQPVPDDQYSITVSSVRKVPNYAPGDYIQIGRELLSGVIGWAKQICLFKRQGTDLQAGVQSGMLLLEAAKQYNEDRILASQYLTEMYAGGIGPTGWHPIRKAGGGGQQEVDLEDKRDRSNSRLPRGSNYGYTGATRKRLGGR